MAGGIKPQKGGSRFGADDFVSDINVTPFVDVMLVLLIVFMVAAPMMTVTVPLELPKSGATTAPSEPITVSFREDGELYLMNDPVALEDLVARVKALESGDPATQRILIRGDTGADYGKFVAVMAALSLAGYTRLGIVTEEEQP